jgi:hypothetical protein
MRRGRRATHGKPRVQAAAAPPVRLNWELHVSRPGHIGGSVICISYGSRPADMRRAGAAWRLGAARQTRALRRHGARRAGALTARAQERGFSFLPLNSASSDTPATLTTLKRTPGISPTAWPRRPNPAMSTSSYCARVWFGCKWAHGRARQRCNGCSGRAAAAVPTAAATAALPFRLGAPTPRPPAPSRSPQ